MNSLRGVLSVFCLIGMIGNLGLADSGELYWVPFVKPLPSRPRLLMQINYLGEIVKIPTLIQTSNLGGSIAIAHGSAETLLMWVAKKFKPAQADGPFPLYRLRINKKTLTVMDERKTQFQTINPFNDISVSQRVANNFLTFTIKGEDPLNSSFGKMLAFGLNENGFSDGSSWQLIAGEGKTGNVSADGKMSSFILIDSSTLRSSILVQPLNSFGKPKGDSQVLVRRSAEAIDVSNRLSDGTRLVVHDGTAATRDDYGLFIQKIDAGTGKRLTEPIRIFRDRNNRICDVAIEPQGRFILFSIDGGLLNYQALDATGHTSGTPKVLVNVAGADCIFGLDILKD